jgi:DNA-binding MarR family transcriptional regulator
MIEKGNDITRLLDKLVSLGLAKRELCENNRRMMDVYITDKGLELLNQIEAPLKKYFAEMRKRLSDAEAEQLSVLLDKLRG